MRFVVLLLATGCGSAASDVISDDDDDFEPPDVAGVYTSSLSDASGCDVAQPPLGWAEGPLTLTGAGEALAWGFDGVTLDGAVDASFTWYIGDSAEVDGWALDVSGQGLAYIDADLWVLEGDMVVDAVDPDGAACTLTGLLVARELQE